MVIVAFRRAIKDIRDNKFLNVVSMITIALSVFIVSAFSFFFNNATNFLDAWQQGVRIIAYLADEVPEEDVPKSDVPEPDQSETAGPEMDRAGIREKILALEGVATVVFVSKADAYRDLQQKIGKQSSLLDGLDKNPLPDAFEITLDASFRNLDHIARLAGVIAQQPHVEEVEYAQKWLHRFSGIYNLFKITGLVLAGIFFIATFLIIANTIRLIMYSRREEIEIIRIIGADAEFIKYPLFIAGMAQGFFGSICGIGLLYAAFVLTIPGIPRDTVFALFEIRFISGMFAITMVLCSMLIGWVACVFSIRKFLKF